MALDFLELLPQSLVKRLCDRTHALAKGNRTEMKIQLGRLDTSVTSELGDLINFKLAPSKIS
jgi:hypothetical protein